jgi:hypothetical protein
VVAVASAPPYLYEAASAHAEHRLRGQQLPVHVLPTDCRARQITACKQVRIRGNNHSSHVDRSNFKKRNSCVV